jgi:hypothetical protein
MSLGIKTNRRLWGRAASRCSLPNCRRDLVIDPYGTDDASLVGEAAHIVAESVDGPRGDSPLPLDQRNRYENLILLCNVHHKQIDDQVSHFTVERLHIIKREHEAWVQSSLSEFNPIRQADDEMWAGYIDEWATMSDLLRWRDHVSFLLGATPAIEVQFLSQLDELRTWIVSRVWPVSHVALRTALENFHEVIDDLVNVFRKYAEHEKRGSLIYMERFYKNRLWDEETYRRLVKEFDFHVALIHDLTFEATRAANYICDKVREKIDRSFRISEGVLLVERASRLVYYTYRPEYLEAERTDHPYPGLDEFMETRSSRAEQFGEGYPPE